MLRPTPSVIPDIQGSSEVLCVLKGLSSDQHGKGLLHTCLDETGKWKDKQLSFAGWISDSPRWHVFQQEWDDLLVDYPGITTIHMSTLMRRGNDQQYQNHVFTVKRSRERLVNRAVDIINKHTLAMVACGVDCEAYGRVMSQSARKKIGRDAHVFVFRRVMKHIVDALQELKWPYPTALILDDNREYGKECYSHYSLAREHEPSWRQSFGSIAFADDEVYPPLQAADILAWFMKKRHENGYDGRFDKMIKRLIKGKPSLDHYYDEAALKDFDVKLTEDVL